MIVFQVLLVACAAGCVTAWEALPNIPAHRRAEYYLLHGDGAYKYGYDTGEGSSHMAQADSANEVRGTYAYQGPSGPVQLAYTAGIGGFIPNIQGAQSGAVAVEAYSASSSSGAAHSAGAHSQIAQSSSSASQHATDAHYDENADASYSFNIDTDEYKRHEASDPKGNVNGRYSYKGKDGNNVAVTYSAGAGTGFVIESQEGLDAASQVSSVPASPPAIPYHAAPAAPKIPARITPFVPAPAPKIAAPVVPNKPYSGPFADITSTGPFLDGSYSFSYGTPELDRTESADANGLVQGRYSFVAADGARHSVDYRAGSLLGYVPQGVGINPVPDVPVVPVATSYANKAATSSAAHSSYQAQSQSSNSGYQAHAASSEESNEPADASYGFEYQADDHSRKESSDAAGNIEGVYSFTDPEGVSRTVQYVAGANKGFVVKESVQAGIAKAIRPSVKAAVAVPIAPAAIPASSGYSASSASSSASKTSSANTDASYSFAYQADDHARQESSDAQGNVKGFYSFTALDGINRKIDYQAGANRGFIATGDHLEVAPVAATRLGSSAASHSASSGYAVKNAAAAHHTAAQNFAQVSTSQQAAAPIDASYSFSYDTGAHAHQQSSDPSGYVRGHYSFIADDGVSRSVQYQAGADTGFVATGTHLPSAEGAAVAASSGNADWSSRTASVVPAVRTPIPAPIPVARAPVVAEEEKGDASYSYSYQTDTSSKTESSDAQGNVVGTFTFVGGDGQSRTLNYVAG